jgi:hypothetical protein
MFSEFDAPTGVVAWPDRLTRRPRSGGHIAPNDRRGGVKSCERARWSSDGAHKIRLDRAALGLRNVNGFDKNEQERHGNRIGAP